MTCITPRQDNSARTKVPGIDLHQSRAWISTRSGEIPHSLTGSVDKWYEPGYPMRSPRSQAILPEL